MPNLFQLFFYKNLWFVFVTLPTARSKYSGAASLPRWNCFGASFHFKLSLNIIFIHQLSKSLLQLSGIFALICNLLSWMLRWHDLLFLMSFLLLFVSLNIISLIWCLFLTILNRTVILKPQLIKAEHDHLVVLLHLNLVLLLLGVLWSRTDLFIISSVVLSSLFLLNSILLVNLYFLGFLF